MNYMIYQKNITYSESVANIFIFGETTGKDRNR